MQRLTRQERIAAWLWVILAVVAWNGIYDLLLDRGANEYLARANLHDGGRTLTVAMDGVIQQAIWISTLWAGLILLAGLATIRLLKSPTPNSQLPR